MMVIYSIACIPNKDRIALCQFLKSNLYDGNDGFNNECDYHVLSLRIKN